MCLILQDFSFFFFPPEAISSTHAKCKIQKTTLFIPSRIKEHTTSFVFPLETFRLIFFKAQHQLKNSSRFYPIQTFKN